MEGVEKGTHSGTGFDFGGSFARAAASALPVGEPIGVNAVQALHQVVAEGGLAGIEAAGRRLGAR